MKKFVKFLIVLIFILAIILGIVAGFFIEKMDSLNIIKLDSNLQISSKAQKLRNYENIALFAVDSRNVNSNEGSRSDGIIIISINKFTSKVNLVSVYRDTYVQIPGYGLDKITHAYAYGGAELAIETLNLNFDLNIKKFVTVNFLAVANLINSLGEIEVEIDDEELAELNKYIPDTMEHTGLNSNLLLSSGKKSLDGVQAVTYARIRKISGGDYARNDRMRTVITTTFEKFKEQNIFKMNELIDEMLPQIQTNLSKLDIICLMARLPFIKINESIGFPFDTQGVTLNLYYGVPKTLQSNVSELHEKLFNQTSYVPSDTVIEISNEIIKKTGVK